MTLGRLCLQVVPLTRGACFLDHCDISEPAGEPKMMFEKVKLHSWHSSELRTLVKLYCLTCLLWLMGHFSNLTHKLSGLPLTHKESS